LEQINNFPSVEAVIKAPTSNTQLPEKLEPPSLQGVPARLASIGIWIFDILRRLVLDAWCLKYRPMVWLLTSVMLAGCATAPPSQIQRPPNTFPADALITQRGILTVLGRQFTLNGYLARSATNGQRLIITENFGGVLADVLVKPDGAAQVMRSSRAFKPKWIERYIAADVRCLFGNWFQTDCPGQMLSPTHFRIERRWYKLDLQIVEIKPGPQPAEMFQAPKAKFP